MRSEGVAKLSRKGPSKAVAHVVVVGPGALGTLFAVRLAQAGHQITMACRTSKTAKAVAKQGLILEDDRGTHTVDVVCVHKPKQLEAPADAIVVATKCHDARDAVETWSPSDPAVPVICLQNGLESERTATVAGPGFVPATVGFPASWEGPGRSIETGHGAIHLGRWPSGPPSGLHERAEALLSSVAPVFVSTNMAGVAWSKVLINSVGMVGAVTGQGLGELLQDKRARDVFLAIMEEGHQSGLAAGITFEKVAGFHPNRLKRLGQIGGRRAQHAAIGLIGRKYRRMRSSSLQGLARGQKTEVAYLNAAIVETARRYGIATPANDAVVHLVQQIEGGHAPPHPRLLAAIPV